MSVELDYRRCVEELRRHDLLPPSYLSMFAGGSTVRGWGNARSDLDVFVITTSPWQSDSAQYEPVALRPDRVMIEAIHVGDVRWDVEYWLESQVGELFEKVSPGRLTGVQPAGQDLTDKEIDFLRMLYHSAPVDGDDWWEARRRCLAESPVRTIMALRALHRLDIYTEDVAGQLAAGDVHSAVLSAKLAWQYAIDALLCSRGEFGTRPKWFARALRIVEPDELGFDEFWAVETMRSFDPDAPARWVEEVIGLCQRIATETAL